MTKPAGSFGFGRVACFVGLLGAIFILLGWWTTELQGGGGAAAAGVSAERGETIFWGTGPVDGTCHTCHSIGDKGSMTRCPNLGAGSALGAGIWERAGARAAERRAAGATAVAGDVDYLIEALTDPGAYIVEGYTNIMPAIHKPPVALGPNEIKSVILYMMSLGGSEVDPTGIKLPDAVYAAASGDGSRWQPYHTKLTGHPGRGKAVFFAQGAATACFRCHAHTGQGGEVGPDLTHVGDSQPIEYLIESIVDPSAVIVAGYETTMLVTGSAREGGRLEGITYKELLLAYQEKRDLKFNLLVRNPDNTMTRMEFNVRDLQDKPRQDKSSTMPPGLADSLGLQQFHDLLAFLSGAPPPPPEPEPEDDDEDEDE